MSTPLPRPRVAPPRTGAALPNLSSPPSHCLSLPPPPVKTPGQSSGGPASPVFLERRQARGSGSFPRAQAGQGRRRFSSRAGRPGRRRFDLWPTPAVRAGDSGGSTYTRTTQRWSASGRLGRGSPGPGLGGHYRLTAGGGACGSGLGFAPHHEGLAAVVTFFAGGDRPVKAGW
jgi:hypothetical protein